MSDAPASRGRVLWRGVVGRCPRCGSRGIFKHVMLDLREDCPTCGLVFAREDGYWVGAMTVSIATVIVVFAAVLGGGLALTWPDVPWTALLVTGLVVNGLVPILGYGWAKSIWMGIDRAFSDVDGAK